MPVSAESRARIELTLPPSDETRDKLRNYLGVLDLSIPQFAPMIGYSPSTLNAYMAGKYREYNIARSDVLIREAIEQYITRHPLQVNGSMNASGKLYETENTAQLRELFHNCHANSALAVLYGPPGSQKTFVAEHLVAEFNRRELAIEGSVNRAYLVRCSVNMGPRDLMAAICRAVNVPSGATLQRCLGSIRVGLRARKVALLIDEAQLAGIPALEALRELYDRDGVGVLLMGSHRLREMFEQRAAELEQFNSRIEDLVELKGVSEKSARAILAVEIPNLNRDAVEAAIEYSRVTDAYSRERGKTYISVRRLFKMIANFRTASQEKGQIQ